MKRWPRPRVWIALMAGIAAGCLTAMLPPRPSGTFAPPVRDPADELRVLSISSDGRYVVTRQGEYPEMQLWDRETDSMAVWDRQGDSQTPLFEHKGSGGLVSILLSPDNSVFALVKWIPPAGKFAGINGMIQMNYVSTVTLYELPSGRELNLFTSPKGTIWFWFAPDGTLLCHENGAVRELENGREVKKLPARIDGYTFLHVQGKHAVYAKEANPLPQLRVYAWRTGELRASASLSKSDHVTQISDDGRVFCWVNMSLNTIGLRNPRPTRIVDTSTGMSRYFDSNSWDNGPWGEFAAASRDGEVLAFRNEVTPLPNWLQWLPIQRAGRCLRVTRWKTNEELAAWPTVKEVCFSADGKHLAAVREDHVIEFYDFPFRKPWGLIAGVALVTAASSWSAAWLWAHRRSRAKTAPPVAKSGT